MTHDEITEILKSHAEWLQNCERGKHADLSYANLSYANLRGVKGVIVASCHWTYHGEQGRQVNAMLIDNTIMFFCGCFIGDELKLRQYIENGDVKLQGSRLKALDFLLTCFEPTE